ncbi:MAG: glycosyltransferase family 2 protein [Lentisphaerae bacterium]|nr:glycosyltransferase family 2 protein [Lentisphaerota bacterium]
MSDIPPVAIFGFIRPHTTAQVFARVREARPKRLFLCLDAPRPERPDDLPKYQEVRAIFDQVDWPCEVARNYADLNMGCRRRMGSGISWVFEQVEEAILLEDDCVPAPTFFPFCTELLERYRSDMRVGMIAGHIEHLLPIKKDTSYYFDRMPTIWGWATWRRAWARFDAELSDWPRLRDTSFLETVFPGKRGRRRVASYFEAVHAGKANSWATAWWLTCLRESYLCAHPSVNQVTNIGFGSDSAHNARRSCWHNQPVPPMAFPLIHPREVAPDLAEERRLVNYFYGGMSLPERAVRRGLRMVGSAWRQALRS